MDPKAIPARALEMRSGSTPTAREGRSSGSKPRTAAALRARIQELLDAGEIREACRLTAEAATQYPGDSHIRETHKILNEGRAVTQPATGHDVREEIEWLRDPPEEYRGRWVALIGREVVASAATARELEASLPPDLEQIPLAIEVAE